MYKRGRSSLDVDTRRLQTWLKPGDYKLDSILPTRLGSESGAIWKPDPDPDPRKFERPDPDPRKFKKTDLDPEKFDPSKNTGSDCMKPDVLKWFIWLRGQLSVFKINCLVWYTGQLCESSFLRVQHWLCHIHHLHFVGSDRLVEFTLYISLAISLPLNPMLGSNSPLSLSPTVVCKRRHVQNTSKCFFSSLHRAQTEGLNLW